MLQLSGDYLTTANRLHIPGTASSVYYSNYNHTVVYCVLLYRLTSDLTDGDMNGGPPPVPPQQFSHTAELNPPEDDKQMQRT